MKKISKTTFVTLWGTYEYLRMPFGLINVGATSQRDLDYAFRDIIGKILEIYEDDLTVHSKSKKSHINHLRQVFEMCCGYNISLNSKNSIFGVLEGKLLAHVVSKDGVEEDPERVRCIKEIESPRSKKALQPFFGKINFIRRFIPNFAENIKPLNKFLKKDAVFKCDKEATKAFNAINEAIVKFLVLVSPNYSKPFKIFSFASTDTIAGVLLQKND